MKKIIPSFLTILNLVCGCLAIALAFQFQFEAVLILVCLGVFFDFLDGLAARALDSVTNFGKHLDSITDVITSGVVPGIIVYQLFKLSGNKVSDFEVYAFGYDLIFSLSPISFIGLIVPHFSRLLIGNDFKYILPFSALIGALTLSSADLLSRLGPIEIPVGIVTALVGAPIFMIILYKKSGYKK